MVARIACWSELFAIDRDLLEGSSQVGQRFFYAHSFKTGGPDEALGIGHLVYLRGVVRRIDRSAMGQEENIWIHRSGGIKNGLAASSGIFH